MTLSPLGRLLLWPFSLLYGGLTRLRASLYAHGVLKQKRLNHPVISIGNLTVGGTGKTPMVIWLAQRLLADGHRESETIVTLFAKIFVNRHMGRSGLVN